MNSYGNTFSTSDSIRTFIDVIKFIWGKILFLTYIKNIVIEPYEQFPNT